MNNLIRFAVAGALAAGGGIVHAQALPSGNSSDLWLFVADTATQTTFAVDTGESINSLLPASDYSTTADLQPVNDGTINMAANAALASFISTADGAGQASDLEWAVEGVNFNGSTTAKHYSSAGGIVGLASNAQATAGDGYANGTIANLQSWGNGFQTDVEYLAATYTSGGTSYQWANGSVSGSAWGDTTGSHAPSGSTNEYSGGALPDQSGTPISGSETLYAVTGNGAGLLESYVLGTVTLAANGALTLSSGTTVTPLPPAVWLLGSGLLGLAGVGRRRKA